MLTTVLSFISSKWKGIWNSIKAAALSIWNGIKTSAVTIWNAVKNAVVKPVNSMKTILSSAWNGIRSTAASAWNRIKTAMINPITSAKDKISGIVKKIKGIFPLSVGRIFSNLRLPKITVSGGKAPYGIAGKGSLPKFNVQWNAKGGIFDAASIIGYGVGEKGAEAIIPLDRFWKQLDSMAASIIDGVAALSAPSVVLEGGAAGVTIDYDKMATAFVSAMTGVELNSTINVDGRTIAKATAPFMNREINSLNARAGRKLGTL